MAKKSESNPLDQPSRRTVETLLRELQRGCYRKREKHDRLYRQLEKLKKKLLDVPEVKDLEKKVEEAWSEEYHQRVLIESEIRRVRQLYLCQGLTEPVKREIQKLVDRLNRPVV